MYPRLRIVIAVIFMIAFSSLALAGPNVVQLVEKPGALLADDIAKTKIKLDKSYTSSHPHMLFSEDQLGDIRKKSEKYPEIWKEVLDQANWLSKNTPTSDQVREGYKYWRAEWMFSGAMAYKITGHQRYLDITLEWMLIHCQADVWGVAFNSNHDLEASWNTYYISLAYDILYNDIPEADRKTIAKSLAEHSEAIYKAKSSYKKFTYDQNHLFIPVTALTAGALALADDYPEQSSKWLNFAAAAMNRSRYVLGSDGFYYEGPGYWLYAMHWHIRYADMMQRVTGDSMDFFDLPVFTKNNLYGQHTSLPDSPFVFDFGDTGKGPRERSTEQRGAWASMLYRIGSKANKPEFVAVADKLRANGGNNDPAMTLLWYWDGGDKKPDFKDAKPYHHFDDHGIVYWRSGWDDDDACYMFKAGPPLGHEAAAKFDQLKDWSMNTGHVHPDIGMFWIYANGKPMAMDTGYLYKKYTDDHSTLLVDGKGIANEGDYHCYHHMPYERYDNVKIVACDLNDDYGYVAADMGSAWESKGMGKLDIIRHIIMCEEFVLVVDDIKSEKPHNYSFLINTEQEEYSYDSNPSGWGNFYQFDDGSDALRIYPIYPGSDRVDIDIAPNEVLYGRGPQTGEKVTTGGQMRINTKQADTQRRFVVLMVPSKSMDIPPQTKLLRNDTQAVELKFNYHRIGINLIEKKAYFTPPRGNNPQ